MNFSQLSDEELLCLIREDNTLAFEALYRKAWEPLYVFAFRRLKSEDDARDVVQDVFIRFWTRRADISLHSTLDAYLFSAVRYEVLDRASRQLRDKARAEEAGSLLYASITEIVDQMQLDELQAAIDRQVDLLPPRMRQVYRMSREESLSIPEIAARLGLSEYTVRNQLSAALVKLRSGLKEAFIAAIFLEFIS